MSMTDMISSDFKTGSYKVWRRSSTTYASGVYNAYEDVELDLADDSILAGLFTKVAHGLTTGQGPIYPSVDTGELPDGMPSPFWAIRVDDDTFRVASSRSDALTEDAEEVDELEAGQTLHLENSFVQTMSISPVGGRETTDEESGNETAEDRLIFSEVELYGRAPGFDPDQVEIDGEFWEVGNVKRWEGFGERFFECVATRLDVP